jgi:hypothetical protein
MVSKTPMRRPSFVFIVLSFVSLTACKSGLGERCQVNADCADGLVCAAATDTCAESAVSENDAGIDAPQDGPEGDADEDAAVDATPEDAADADVDAPPDAP